MIAPGKLTLFLSLVLILIGFFIPAIATSEEQKATTAAGETASFQEAASIVDAFHDALSRGDREAALAALDDQVQIFEQGWVERSKAEYASHHLESDAAFSKAVTSTQTARAGAVIGDLAYIATESRAAGRFKDKDVDSVAIETMVLRRDQAGWRIVHIHWSSRDAKK